jgi:hypothetical protein
MAATTRYGGAPLPDLPPRAEKLEALRHQEGGWARQQRQTQRCALTGAMAFCAAGLAVLALVSSPGYRAWEDGYAGEDGAARAVADFGARSGGGGGGGGGGDGGDGGVDGGSYTSNAATAGGGGSYSLHGDATGGDAGGVAAAARNGEAFSRRRKDVSALGAMEATKIWKELAQALPEPQLLRLMALRAASRVMPQETFESYARLAQEVAAEVSGVEGEAEGSSEEKRGELVTKLGTMTVMDADTARLIAHFSKNPDAAAAAAAEAAVLGAAAADSADGVVADRVVADGGVQPVALAEFVSEVLPVLRKYPEWDYSDGGAVQVESSEPTA